MYSKKIVIENEAVSRRYHTTFNAYYVTDRQMAVEITHANGQKLTR